MSKIPHPSFITNLRASAQKLDMENPEIIVNFPKNYFQQVTPLLLEGGSYPPGLLLFTRYTVYIPFTSLSGQQRWGQRKEGKNEWE